MTRPGTARVPRVATTVRLDMSWGLKTAKGKSDDAPWASEHYANTTEHYVQNTISQHHLHHFQQTLYVQETFGNGAHDEGLQTNDGNYCTTYLQIGSTADRNLAGRSHDNNDNESDISFFAES